MSAIVDETNARVAARQRQQRARADAAKRRAELPADHPDRAEWLTLLRLRTEQLGSNAAVANELGYSRTAVSLALAGKYPAKDTRLAAAVITKYKRCQCPYLGREIVAVECRANRTRPMPQSLPDALRFWSTCQTCPVGAALAQAEAITEGAKP